jgi:preprotein translocase subunit SecF
MSEEFEVQGEHDRAVEHAAEHEPLGRWVAVFTAVLATLGAIVSYQNGNSESRGLEYKNAAILKKSEASDAWSYYQAKSVKEAVVRSAYAPDEPARARLATEAERYAKEKADIEKQARALDAQAHQLDERSEVAVRPHHRLAQALVLVQVAIALAALTVLTRQRWMLALSGVSAAAGVAFWVLAWVR